MISSLVLMIALQSTTPGVYRAEPLAPPPPKPQERASVLPPTRGAAFDACIDAALEDPSRGVASALDWVGLGGGWLARQCLGFSYMRGGDYASAADAFARAASEAEVAQPDQAATLWVQAGNAALASGDARKAAQRFDAALARGSLTGLELGEAHLDRARARVAAGDMAGAATDLERAREHAAADPLVWLLSATFARRQDDLVSASEYIAEAARLASRDPATMLEAGNIAILTGREDAARANWQAAIETAPDSMEAASARENLERLDAATATAAAPGNGS